MRQSVGMIAADLDKVVQPCSAAVADPSFANVALRMRAQSRSMMGALLGPLLTGSKTTELDPGLELRAHRCAPQRIILTLPLGVRG